MRKLLFIVGCTLAVMASAAPVGATSLTFQSPADHYIGFFRPPEPSSLASEVGYINTLIGVAPGANLTVEIAGPPKRTYYYDRAGSTATGLSPADLTGAVQFNSLPANGIYVGGWTYLLAKYDGPNGGAMVWYVGDLTNVDIPSSYDLPGGQDGAQGLSHYSLFNPYQQDTPDGGATLMLLGGALIGMGALRRRLGN